MRRICWALRFLAAAIDLIVSFLYSGESALPRGEYPEQWMPLEAQ
jgi:hypothetical protein